MTDPYNLDAKLWQNKITRHTEESPEDLLAHPLNFRIHTELQQAATVDSLDRLGWVKSVIVNENTGTVVDGHERVMLAMRKRGQKVPVEWVDLTEEEEALALMSLDHIVGMAVVDHEKLIELSGSIDFDEGSDLGGVLSDFSDSFIPEDEDEQHTREVVSPVYEPANEKPEISELYDDKKTRELIADIEACDGLTDDEREFLIVAARRHTVINFSLVADYYANSSKVMQRLMEDSALVIIDFGRAIELGFVKLTKNIAEMAGDDYE